MKNAKKTSRSIKVPSVKKAAKRSLSSKSESLGRAKKARDGVELEIIDDVLKKDDSLSNTVRRRPGRPKGSGKYKEPTRAVRVPISLIDRIMALVERKGFVFPIYLDRIQAGYPSPAEDAPSENLDVAEYLVPNPSSTFFITVTGESMRDAGIFPGDLLIVDRSLEADNGDVVVALVDGEFTVKRLFKTVNRVELRPENKRFSVIVLEDESEVIVWGVVRRVIHNV